MRMEETIDDLIAKIRKFSTAQNKERKVYMWRIGGRGGRGSNKFNFVSQNTEEELKRTIFRYKKETEVFYLRYHVDSDDKRQSSATEKLEDDDAEDV